MKFKMLATAVLLGLSSLASAIDLNHGIKVMHANKPVLDMGVTYFGLTKAEHAQMLVTENKFLNSVEQTAKTAAAQTARDKNRVAEYSIVLTGQMIDDSGTPTLFPPIFYEGLTLKDVNKMMRANQSYTNTLVGNSEMNAAKGKKPWGNK